VSAAGTSAVVAGTFVVCRDVAVTFGDGDSRVVALAGIDLELATNETVALWGRSGSGKTTLLHVLGGLVVPVRGEVLWKGRELSSLDAAARGRLRAAGIAYVFQGSNLLPHFTAYENVAFAARAAASSAGGRDGGGMSGERAAAAAAQLTPEELLALVGLAAKLDALPAELSGGEAQRVAIARALAQRPELLLCDEPTGQLDSDTAERVLDLIYAIQREFGFAVVIATHDADVAARAGRTVALFDGRVADEVGA
jgi:ABC-type lipoprotein export system ATPase subunit